MGSVVEDFMIAVEEGLKLLKRIYYGKDRVMAPPSAPPPMSKSPKYYLPTAPMVYAVIYDPGIVDNPDIPSYQPYVHGKLDPPALIPLPMTRVTLQVDCYLDTVFVRVSGHWRVHCVKGNKSCDCRIAVPMGEQGSILGVEVDVPRKSYRTQLALGEDKQDDGNASGGDDGVFLKPDVFMLTIPLVDGGTNLHIRLSWSQKLVYRDGEFSLCLPFSFPEYVAPANKKIPKKEKIELNVCPGDGNEVLCKSVSHPLKESQREVGKLSFLYELDVFLWSNADFSFSYSVLASHTLGNVIVRSPSVDDIDQREMFYIHILPGSVESKKVFTKIIIYVVDISGSMEGKPVEDVKRALCAALSELNPEDSFNIIAFNGQTFLFSSSLRLATQEAIEDAIQWIGINFVAGEGTNISLGLDQAMEMLPATCNSLSMIFLITDGAVEDERRICDKAKSRLSNPACFHIHTFGIGLFCNHYFLRMLAMIGGGHYDAAYDTDFIESRLLKLIHRASSTVLANMSFETLGELKDVEVYPTRVPDLSSESPLIISGRYSGKFPEVLKARGKLADLTNYEMEMKVREAEEFPIEKLLAIHQISFCTAQAWLLEDKQLETKVAMMSVHNSISSEYTSMVLLMSDTLKKEADGRPKKKKTSKKSEAVKEEPKPQRVKELRNLGIGFGDVNATAENIPPGLVGPRTLDSAEMIVQAASNFCSKICRCCCCSCCIKMCPKMNNQCSIFLTQLSAALTICGCRGCFQCCQETCRAESKGS